MYGGAATCCLASAPNWVIVVCMRKRIIAGVILIVVIIAALYIGLHHKTAQQQTTGKTASSNKTGTAQPNPSPGSAGFNMRAYSTTDASSLWIVVNKRHPLVPKSYVPASLSVPSIPLRSNISSDEQLVSSIMKPELENMVNAAQQQGIRLNLQSGYRSYTFQVNLYNSYVRTQGQATADRQSARPGYSEHQTG